MSGHRAKRQRYTKKACNECKRRKAKCDGASICDRCASFGIDCVYSATSEESREGQPKEPELLRQLNTKIDSLQSQVESLVRTVQTVQAGNSHSSGAQASFSREDATSSLEDSIRSTVAERSHFPAYLGPTSSTFGLDVAQLQLQHAESVSSRDLENPQSRLRLDGIVQTSQVDIFRLIALYEGTVGELYPCIDLDEVRKFADDLFNEYSENTYRIIYHSHASLDVFDKDFEILRAILSIGMVIEGDGESRAAAFLMDRIENIMYKRFKIYEVDTSELLLLFLMSLYHFHRGDEVMAHRNTGLAVRGALEMGLHRRSSWERNSGNFPGNLQRIWAVKLFWCIYCLDRRWSLATGLPFALQDADMDVELPQVDETTPCLNCMVSYGRLATKIWRAVTDRELGAQEDYTERTTYLDFLVQQWLSSIPTSLRPDGDAQTPVAASAETETMLRVLFHLEANQLRIILHKPYLLSKKSIARNAKSAHLVVGLAGDSIKRIDSLNRTTSIYEKRRVAFESFLVSAVAVFCLVTSYAPEEFYSKVQHDFSIAVELVKGFLATSMSARRLWKTIRQIKHLNASLPLVSTSSSRDTLATHRIAQTPGATPGHTGSQPDVSDYYEDRAVVNDSTGNPTSPLSMWPEDAFQVSRELDSIFEEFGRSCVDLTSNENDGSGEWDGLEERLPSEHLAPLSSHVNSTEFSRLFMNLF